MMKYIVLLLIVGSAMAHPFKRDLDEPWKKFKKHFRKRYRSTEESPKRMIWEQNEGRIRKHNLEANKGKYSYRMKLNEITDLDLSEVIATRNGYRRGLLTADASNLLMSSSSSFPSSSSNISLPDTVDWRKEGLVTPVKNQKKCGSCWAFSATGALEGQQKKKNGKLVPLSEQNLVDCSSKQGNLGCQGLMRYAFNYIKVNPGINTGTFYPYKAKDGSCKFNESHVGSNATGYVTIPSGDENALKRAVATVGPISAAIDASHFSFQAYGDGIYDESECSSSAIDHAILIVGYGTEDGRDYWLVKNSWGTSWGLDGYVKMSRNKKNQCGIATIASYPLV